MALFSRRSRKAVAAGLLMWLSGTALAGPDIPSAFQQATCSPYVSGQSRAMMACNQNGFTAVAGMDSATGTIKELATVSDYTMMGKKPVETFSTSLFLIDEVNSKVYLGSATFNFYPAVVKTQNTCGQGGFIAGFVVNADVTCNDYVGGAVYLVPCSFHSDEAAAEKAAAALSADDPGETGDYPPGMSPSLTEPTNPSPHVTFPPEYIPRTDPPPPADHAQKALDCFNAYRAACRTAFTNYKNTLANARYNRFSGSSSGATVGAAIGGAGGGVAVLTICAFFGPPGWATGLGIITVGGVAGGAVGAIAGPTISYTEAKQAAQAVLRNDMTSALAAYRKCLEAAGYVHNPLYH